MSDLHIGVDRATDAERAAVDAVAAEAGPVFVADGERLVRGGATRRDERRHLLLPALHALQRTAGWISPGGVNHLAEVLAVPPAETYGVATFYDLFTTEEPGHDQDVLHVCVDAACQISGAAEVIDQATTAGLRVRPSPCLGQCERPVARFVQGRNRPDQVPTGPLGSRVEAEPGAVGLVETRSVAGDPPPAPVPQQGQAELRLLRRVGVVDPTSLESYVAAGGYRPLAQAFIRSAAGVIAEVEASKLTGRGGAAFPTGVKWRAVAAESGQKHIVVNGDESEPGTFKDRVVMEHDPFALIEAATIAGFAVGASKGWIYVRGEYPLAVERLTGAIEQATAAGFLGPSVARSGFSFEIEVRRGAGAYICGEETALFNSIEGYRGEPRQKPPFPTTHGLFGQPTAINNPETLLNVLDIVEHGGAAHAAMGTDGSTGTKLFCLSGNVAVPGLYEVPFGPTLGEVLALAGGVTGELQAVLLGGAAGSFVGPDQLDLPLTQEATRAAGLSLGSGVVMAFDTSVDLTPVVTRIAEFFRHESCGQCVPCRVGTVRQHELLVRSSSRPRPGSPPEPQPGSPAGGGAAEVAVSLLAEMDLAMKDASICGLGHTAGTAVRSAVELGLIELT